MLGVVYTVHFNRCKREETSDKKVNPECWNYIHLKSVASNLRTEHKEITQFFP
jgi:hypothetical protein